MVRRLTPTLACAVAVLAGGCTLSLSGIGGPDAAGDRDAEPPPDAGDAGVPRPDAGPNACPHRGRAEVVAELGAADWASGNLDGVVEESGSLGLPGQTYFFGAAMVGYEGTHVNDVDPRTTDLDGVPRSLTALLPGLERGWGSGEGVGLGVGIDFWSARAVGQMFLTVGSHTFEVDGDDRVVFELGLPVGVQRVSDDFASGPATLAVMVPTTGWYDYAVAMEESVGDAYFYVRIDDGMGGFRSFAPSELRVDMANVEGRQMFGWNEERPDDTPNGLRIDAERTSADWRRSYPPSLGINSSSTWSARWVGTFQITPGIGTLGLDSERRHFVFVDGVFRESGSMDQLPLELGAGPHELIVELQENNGDDGRIEVTWEDTVFEPADMRAHGRTGGTLFSRGAANDVDVMPMMSGTQTVDLRGPNSLGTFAEVSAILDGVHEPSQVSLSWSHGVAGTQDVTLEGRGRRIPDTDAFEVRAVFDPVADPSGNWTLTVTNDGSSQVTIDDAGVIGHYAADRDAYPVEGTWTSAPIMLGESTAIDRVEVDGYVPSADRVRAFVRVADRVEDLAAAPLTEASPDGYFPSAPEGSVAQVSLGLSSDRITTPRIWGARLHGRTCLECDAPEGERCGPWQRDGIEALYPFEEMRSGLWPDLSGALTPANLALEREAEQRALTHSARWNGDAVARSEGTSADRIATAVAASGEVTLEAWVIPGSTQPVQGSDAVIASYSVDPMDRLLTLSLRANAAIAGALTTSNGPVEVTSAEGAFRRGALVHLVLTRESASGEAVLYVDGAEIAREPATGDLSPWVAGYALHAGNQAGGGSHFLGELHLLVVYSRALDATEVAEHYAVGPEGGL